MMKAHSAYAQKQHRFNMASRMYNQVSDLLVRRSCWRPLSWLRKIIFHLQREKKAVFVVIKKETLPRNYRGGPSQVVDAQVPRNTYVSTHWVMKNFRAWYETTILEILQNPVQKKPFSLPVAPQY